ncbi:hypothetical protein A0H81_08587 [Grifola frondosa]|uniref:Uncharacterized protein n=1 Tax=Grifola frondosa TaxID=5627 RepID=A0A1C7M419_GRIFR|nr:hypothetical protein A0H81_08587 [Grifola frondosa]
MCKRFLPWWILIPCTLLGFCSDVALAVRRHLRLRRLCNADYQVPEMDLHYTVTTDTCSESFSDCCCNSLSFALAMLCLNCQVGAEHMNKTEYDAPVGLYPWYLQSGESVDPILCRLPANIQTAVCSANIPSPDFLYDYYNAGGTWSYTDSRELAQKEQLDNNNNTFSYCPATERELYVYHFSIVGFNNHINNHIIDYIICHIIDHVNNFCSVSGDLKNVRAIVGGTVGGVAGFVALLLGAGLLWWRRRQRKYNSVDLGEDYHVVNNQDNFNSAIITPYPDVMRDKSYITLPACHLLKKVAFIGTPQILIAMVIFVDRILGTFLQI